MSGRVFNFIHRKLPLLFFFFISLGSLWAADIQMITWNLKDFGKTKDANEIHFIAETVRYVDLLAIQEVVAGDGGAQAVARLADELNRMGSKWDYVVSDPTSGTTHGRERYAFIWKTSKLSLVKATLEVALEQQVNREPYLGTFKAGKITFTVASFHAITKSMKPESEIRFLPDIPSRYQDQTFIFCGDFNLSQSHEVFNLFRAKGYRQVITGQKTSLQSKCSNTECLASEYDNIFFDTRKIIFQESRAEKFHKKLSTHDQALGISDHLPVWFRFSLN